MISIRFFFCAFLVIIGQITCHHDTYDAHQYSSDLGDTLESRENLQAIRDEVTTAINDPKAMEALFESFVKKYHRVYVTPAEKDNKRRIFSENLRKYEKMNKADKGTAVYGVDQFSDISDKELREQILIPQSRMPAQTSHDIYDGFEMKKKPPKEFDWRTKNVVTPVKFQGIFCFFSGWVFSAAATLESLYAIKNNRSVDLSPQQMMDCDPESMGCKGGWVTDAIKSVIETKGLSALDTYPWQQRKKECSANATLAVAKVKSVINLPKNEGKLTAYLYENAPFSVHINYAAMRGYRGGISHPPEFMCKKSPIYGHHALTVVGYGEKEFNDSGKKIRLPFWILKNSWDTWFGNQGYYYLYRGDNSCGIANFPTGAILE